MDESKRTVENWQDDKPYVEDKDAKQKQKARDIVESCHKAHPDWTSKQIAEETGVTPSTAAYHLCNIRKEQKSGEEKPAEEKVLVHEVTPKGGKYSFVSKEEAEKMPNATEVPKTERTEKAVMELSKDNCVCVGKAEEQPSVEAQSKPDKGQKVKLSGDEMDAAMENGILRAKVDMLKKENDELRKVYNDAMELKNGINCERELVKRRVEELKDTIVEMAIAIYGGVK